MRGKSAAGLAETEGVASVDAADYAATRAALTPRRVGPGHRFDHNRDGRVNTLDLALVRGGIGRSLVMATAPLGGPFVIAAASASAAASRDRTAPARRSLPRAETTEAVAAGLRRE